MPRREDNFHMHARVECVNYIQIIVIVVAAAEKLTLPLNARR